MKILIKFPTRGRKHKFLNTFKKYYDLCSGIKNIKFLISIDSDDLDMTSKDTLEILNSFKNTPTVWKI